MQVYMQVGELVRALTQLEYKYQCCLGLELVIPNTKCSASLQKFVCCSFILCLQCFENQIFSYLLLHLLNLKPFCKIWKLEMQISKSIMNVKPNCKITIYKYDCDEYKIILQMLQIGNTISNVKLNCKSNLNNIIWCYIRFVKIFQFPNPNRMQNHFQSLQIYNFTFYFFQLSNMQKRPQYRTMTICMVSQF
eukprot:TRINITY_DN982_c0_g1_i12.p1 TRINITY_DN982_c0_g1~~TRINITY_DN982_c0_g1_i12.p1  ORF type:complete len:192 (-),score=-8.08 TRINITY_DN982_c0_g1_i12:127-702(-)